jgi:DNA polymerase-3 subunit beta
MKFICLKENLERALIIAERFTGKNITLPILGNILLEASETALFVTATNLEYAIRIKVAGKIEKAGRVSVPAKIISSLLQSTRSEKVDLEEKQGSLFIKTDTRDIRINGIIAEDFPLLPKIKKTYSITMDGPSLVNNLAKVLPAVSFSEFKPELNGVFFKAANNLLYLAATDTFRLAESSLTLAEKTQNKEINFILPQKTAQEIARLPVKEELEISGGDNQILLETEDIKIISRTIEGNFPAYDGIIPKKFEVASFVNREKLVETIRSASIFASKLQEVRLNLTRQILEVTASNPEIGDYKTKIEVQSSGKSFSDPTKEGGETGVSLGFNFRYLLDGLAALDDEEIFLGLNSENAPTLIRNREDDFFKYVLMPIRIN